MRIGCSHRLKLASCNFLIIQSLYKKIIVLGPYSVSNDIYMIDPDVEFKNKNQLCPMKYIKTRMRMGCQNWLSTGKLVGVSVFLF